MAITLNQQDPDFEQRISAFLSTKREVSADVDAAVRDIIARVRGEGDKALADYTLRFDKADLGKLGVAVSSSDIAGAYAAADPATIEALTFARDRIRSHHERQKPRDDRYT
ncbi:MAG: histidinol dehydrogenase, partial [Mesorhizobium sp.]